MAVFIGIKLFRMARNRGKLNCLILRPSRYYTVKKLKTHGNKIEIDNWRVNPEYKTTDIFQEEKPFYKFWRNPKMLLVLGENTKKALTWGKSGPAKLSSIWTDKELLQWIAKEVAKARVKGPLISNTWAMLILMAVAVVGFICLYGFSRIGAL